MLRSLSLAVAGVRERILIIFLVSSTKTTLLREALPDFGLDNLLIEEDFTVWRDSERCSSVLLGIYLGESLGEKC